MAQRNTDTEIWNTKFVRGLPGPYKAFWIWLQSACNHAGVWEIDLDLARMRTGFFNELNQAEAEQLFKEKIIVLKCGEKWFLKDYPNDQFKTIFLNPTNTYHWGAIVILQKLALMGNDFIVLDKELQRAVKPLYSSSKDAKYKIKSIITNKIVEDSEVLNAPEGEDEQIPTGKTKAKKTAAAKTFNTPYTEAFKGFREMRVKAKKPLTERAAAMIHTKLTEICGDDEALKIKILNKSTLKCWDSVYPYVEDFTTNKPAVGTDSKTENVINLAQNAIYQEQA